MSNATKELLGAFVAEATDRLADTENALLSIEAAGEDVDSEVVNRVFRAIHSIKGTAGYLGLGTIGTLAHEMEGVLNLLRNDQLAPTTPIVDALLRGADALTEVLTEDGYLFVGSSESLMDLGPQFVPRHRGQAVYYQPGRQAAGATA